MRSPFVSRHSAPGSNMSGPSAVARSDGGACRHPIAIDAAMASRMLERIIVVGDVELDAPARERVECLDALLDVARDARGALEEALHCGQHVLRRHAKPV